MDASTAGLIALAMALVKVIEKLVEWATKKRNGKNGEHRATIVQLDPEFSLMIRDMHARVGDISSVTEKTDHLGTPLVYGPRAEVHDLTLMVETVADKVDKVNERGEEILRAAIRKKV